MYHYTIMTDNGSINEMISELRLSNAISGRISGNIGALTSELFISSKLDAKSFKHAIFNLDSESQSPILAVFDNEDNLLIDWDIYGYFY